MQTEPRIVDRAAQPYVAIRQPAGRHATLTYWGHYDGLIEATATLIDWADRKGLRWDSTAGADGERFASRFELYPNGPNDEPDPQKWETQMFIKLAD